MARKVKDPVLRVLSVDWDYFVNATLVQRAEMFPDGGNENLGKTLRDIVWSSRYSDDALDQVDVKDTLDTFMEDLSTSIRSHVPASVWVVDSHAQAYQVIQDTFKKLKKSSIELVNIDFHHDVYGTDYDTEVNCGNWLRTLDREMGTPDCSYTWVGHPDSDRDLWDAYEDDPIRKGSFHFTDYLGDVDVAGTQWDVLFICRSDMWSPPHLDPYFMSLAVEVIDAVDYNTNVMGVSYVMQSRYESLKDLIDMDRSFKKQVRNGT